MKVCSSGASSQYRELEFPESILNLRFIFFKILLHPKLVKGNTSKQQASERGEFVKSLAICENDTITMTARLKANILGFNGEEGLLFLLHSCNGFFYSNWQAVTLPITHLKLQFSLIKHTAFPGTLQSH